MGMKHDVSMIIGEHLNLYEHQSTWNPNLPLRGLLYFANLYKSIIKDSHIYSTRLVKLPTPVYVVFYNGGKGIGEREELRLSDAFTHGNEQSGMELKALVLNINYGHNQDLMEKCKPLAGYSYFVGKVKAYNQSMELRDAISQAVDDCIAADVLKEFLRTRRDEVMTALMTEYDEERVLADLSQEFYEDGVQKGRQEGVQEGIQGERENSIRVLIQTYKEFSLTDEVALQKLMERYAISKESAAEYMEMYWRAK